MTNGFSFIVPRLTLLRLFFQRKAMRFFDIRIKLVFPTIDRVKQILEIRLGGRLIRVAEWDLTTNGEHAHIYEAKDWEAENPHDTE